ncbi:MAG: hypothetical protein DI547_15595 [Sphingobium sp.]|nr:MAG: hypothetical protein DI547_15595 [Sphingobium sp.]
MRVTIRPQADRDLGEIFDWIARDDAGAAERHVRHLVSAALALRNFPKRGSPRPEIAEDARSLVVGRYLILYRVTANGVEIVRFVHAARHLDDLFGDTE